MPRPEAARINVAQYGEYKGVPHIKREFFNPPGQEIPGQEKYDTWKKHGLFTQTEFDTAIESTKNITDAGKVLLRGLLEQGGVGIFGNEQKYDLGIDYDLLLKSDYDHKIVDPAMRELATQMKVEAAAMDFPIDGVLAPEISGLQPAAMFSSYFDDASCVRIKKNGFAPNTIGVAVDSYTSADRTDILSISKSVLQKKFREGKTNFILADDIIDAGFMTQAVALILQLARDEGYDMNLVGIVTPIEKVYTRARQTIQENLGPIPIKSILQIEDIGILDPSQNTAWIKIVGLDKAIQCKLNDTRPKSPNA